MRASRFFISTQKEAPADADVASQALMLRAGMIRKLAAGLYTYMPLGLRSLRKVEAIVREEMNRAGAIELLMPVVQPAELWQESGRWDKFGPELLRMKDRHQRDFVMQPTSEEVITDIARAELRSWRQLPVNFYHIQTKFRDERRPRFGVMRAREFTMKDAYSFDRDREGAQRSYEAMYEAYRRIFERFGFEFRAVAADSGAIGGSLSHEFHVIADTGEDAIAYSPESDYAANVEKAEALPLLSQRAAPGKALERTPTPAAGKCEEVAELLGIALQATVKSVVLATDGEAGTQLVLLLVRGDHAVNEVKVGKLAGLAEARMATEEEIVEWFGCRPGFIGPIGTRRPLRVIADRTVANMHDFVVGANQPDFHYTGVNWGRDLPEPEVADIRNVVEGDPSPDGRGRLAMCRGIEVGHVFYLGTKYSDALQANYIDEAGKSRPLEMGCYGIGITRILGACIEQNHDARGMIWPDALAPFEVVVCPIGMDRSPAVREAAEVLLAELQGAGFDAVLDDRGLRPGAMFADWELIGVPHRLVVSDRGLAAQTLEYQHRRDEAATSVARGEVLQLLRSRSRR
ncbi:MAG: proline--tRNA ligase [Betaproteobacteria bacterium]|nr:proline--tRNA ligase [Betaproteobacteria bacterium]MBU6513013.1 proline--tRNA ligase [Betaproteobacteria bacterium]MDE1956609.1 proline--tRNA ligase [Betaproteobacteria bacterium]MDE2153164.1 proline--tRNA ligase [Betaproteobacteria bacterium]MDE2477511.1 proline--tRNA ligase [Betaproteobacteria bacterium]